MPSKLGQTIRNARQAAGVGLREFAEEIKKSPGFVTQIECEDEVPSVSEETLRTIATKLDLDADQLLVLAERTPSDVAPKSVLEVTLYRKVRGLSSTDQKRAGKYLDSLKKKPKRP